MSTTTDLVRKTFPLEIRSVDEDTGSFEGYAACFHNIDSYGDIIAKSCYTEERIAEFLEDGFIGGLNHNWYDPIGRPVSAVADDKGLLITGTIEETSHGKDVRIQLKKKIVRKLSIGFFIRGRTWLDDHDDVIRYWAENGYTPTASDIAKSKYGARLLTDIQTVETSPVVLPANSGAVILDAKSADNKLTIESSLQNVISFLESIKSKEIDLETISSDLSPALVKKLFDAVSVRGIKLPSSEMLKLKEQTIRQIAEEDLLLAGNTRQ